MYMCVDTYLWICGDYASEFTFYARSGAWKVNRTFFEHRSLEHEVGSLEACLPSLLG